MTSSKSGNFFEDMEAHRKPERQCGLRNALDSMDPAYRAQVVKALRDPRYASSLIADTLQASDYKVNVWSVRRCRKNCVCGALDGPGRKGG